MTTTQHDIVFVLSMVLAGLFNSLAIAGDCPPRYEVTAIVEGPDCGGVWGNAAVSPWGMNDCGDVVGWFSCPAGYDHAFVWYNEGDGSGTFVEIPMPPNEYYSRAYDINNDRYMTGWADVKDDGYGLVGFLYDGQAIEIIVPPLGGSIRPRAINAKLDIVGELSPPDRAVLYRDGVIYDLGPMLTGEASEAFDCNDAGIVVGWAGWLGSPYFLEHAFLIDGDTVTEYGPMPGGLTSRAQAIDNEGRWAGYGIVQDGPDEYSAHALYFDGTTMLDIGTLPRYETSKARDLWNGVVIGRSTTGGQAGLAFLWVNGVMWDLNDLAEAGSIILTSARAINGSGQILCRGSEPDGVGVVLTPVEYLCGDVEQDGSVNVLDLLLVLEEWGQGESSADIDLDGVVDAVDLLFVLEHWGQTLPRRPAGR